MNHLPHLVEYSKTQNAFHICTMDQRLTSDRQARERGVEPDYQILATCNSYDEAAAFVKANYDNVKQYGFYIDQTGQKHTI